MSKASRPGTRREELLEVVDERQRPLGAFPRSLVHARGLLHKSAAVLVYSQEGKLYLQRRSQRQADCPGLWDLSAAGHVRFGEAVEDAAARELLEELGLPRLRLFRLYAIEAGPATGSEFVTLFGTEPCRSAPKPNPKEVSEGMFVERHELAYLIERHAALLTPSLIHFWRLGCLFTHRS